MRDKRAWLLWSAVAGAGLIAAGLGYAFFIEPRRMVVERIELPVPDLAPELHGFTLVQLSDLHCGANRRWAERVQHAVEVANGLEPHLVVLTGDFVDDTSIVHACAHILSGLRAAHDVVAVLGNHDYYGSPRRARLLSEALRRAGIVKLSNEVYSAATTAPLYIVGLDDAYTGHDKLVEALDRLPRRRGVRIMLSHYPDVVERLSPGTCDLVLAGHAHGGQIRLPVLAYLARRYHIQTAYSQGLYMVDGTPLYINRGLGMLFPQARFLSPPEVTHITLVGSSQ